MATNANQLAKSGKFGDLRRRLVFLLLALVVYRLGAHIPVPGIDPFYLDTEYRSYQTGAYLQATKQVAARVNLTRASWSYRFIADRGWD